MKILLALLGCILLALGFPLLVFKLARVSLWKLLTGSIKDIPRQELISHGWCSGNSIELRKGSYLLESKEYDPDDPDHERDIKEE